MPWALARELIHGPDCRVMDVTRTIRYTGASYQEVLDLRSALEAEGVHVEGLPPDLEERAVLERARLEMRRRLRGPGGVGKVMLSDVNAVVINLVTTGTAVAIAAAVKKFRKRAPRGKVEVKGEAASPKDNGPPTPDQPTT
jgi:hypothetical protein